MKTALRVSHTGGPGAWTGVIKDGKRIVWACGHHHRNRDQSTMSSGRSAHSCAGLMLALVMNPDYINAVRSSLSYVRFAWQADDTRTTIAILEAFKLEADRIRASI